MQKMNLEQLWETLSYTGSGQVSYRLMSLESIPSLNLGINKVGQRCLILELPADIRPEIPENSKENISLWYYATENCISIVLNDSYFEDLFNDLIISIYNKIYMIEDAKTYATHFVAYYFKWLNFLDNRNNYLSKEVIKGIWGEVFYLKQIMNVDLRNVNDKLYSWKGPYDKGHDFVSELLDVEVKTIDSGSNIIKISSEFQMENDPSKKLQLVVLSVQDDKYEGMTLEKLVKEVRDLIIKFGGDISAFSDALFQKGLTFGNLSQYDIYPFKPILIQHFNCCDDHFPKIIKSKLPVEIVGVRYSLKLNLIQDFLLSQIEL